MGPKEKLSVWVTNGDESAVKEQNLPMPTSRVPHGEARLYSSTIWPSQRRGPNQISDTSQMRERERHR